MNRIVIALAALVLLTASPAAAGTFSDEFDDGVIAPWSVLHGNHTESGGSLNGSSFSTHVTPSAVVNTGQGEADHVIIEANLTISSGGAGFTMKRNGSDFCGFFLWSQSTIYFGSDNVIETAVYSGSLYSYGTPFDLQAELDGTTIFFYM